MLFIIHLDSFSVSYINNKENYFKLVLDYATIYIAIYVKSAAKPTMGLKMARLRCL